MCWMVHNGTNEMLQKGQKRKEYKVSSYRSSFKFEGTSRADHLKILILFSSVLQAAHAQQ